MNARTFRKRMFATAILTGGLALPGLAIQAQQNQPQPGAQPGTQPGITQPQVNPGRETTLSGKLVDLHQYMTGGAAADRTTGQDDRALRDRIGDRVDPDRDRDQNRPDTPQADRTVPRDADNPARTDRPDLGGASDMGYAKVYALDTGAGLVILGHDQSKMTTRSSVRPDVSGDRTSPNIAQRDRAATEADKDSKSHKDHAGKIGQQVKVTGKLYVRGGMSYLVVDRFDTDQTTRANDEFDRARPATGG